MTPGPPDHAGAPDHAGPPDHVVRGRTQLTQDDSIEVGDSDLDDLAQRIDWGSLTPLERYLLLRIEAIETDD
ncbi:hypothetical protein [Halolamina sp. C58]|uniref:hypothetical protein n=1 Tax=Halolamina sp. C58 TaxID=3421640 RepID=UPI003EBE2AAA